MPRVTPTAVTDDRGDVRPLLEQPTKTHGHDGVNRSARASRSRWGRRRSLGRCVGAASLWVDRSGPARVVVIASPRIGRATWPWPGSTPGRVVVVADPHDGTVCSARLWACPPASMSTSVTPPNRPRRRPAAARSASPEADVVITARAPPLPVAPQPLDERHQPALRSTSALASTREWRRRGRGRREPSRCVGGGQGTATDVASTRYDAARGRRSPARVNPIVHGSGGRGHRGSSLHGIRPAYHHSPSRAVDFQWTRRRSSPVWYSRSA